MLMSRRAARSFGMLALDAATSVNARDRRRLNRTLEGEPLATESKDAVTSRGYRVDRGRR
jgi:hypothetical protein